MSQKWTNLADYMNKMENKLGKPGYFSKDSNKENVEKEKYRQRSAKYLWLA
jgi:hypothetical protein